MPVGPITYLTTRDLIEQAYTQETHALPTALYHLLIKRIAGIEDEAFQNHEASSFLAQVMDACLRLHNDLSRRPGFPRLPTDPHEESRLWHEGVAELVQWWGYTNITEWSRQRYEREARAEGKPSLFDYRYVFQNTESVYYVRTLSDLLIVLDEARHTMTTSGQEQQPPSKQEEEDDDDAPRL